MTNKVNIKDLDANQTLETAYDSTNNAFRIIGAGGTLVTEEFDHVGATYPNSSTEVYTYKVGGSGGTTVATVTVVYTNSSKDTLLSVDRA